MEIHLISPIYTFLFSILLGAILSIIFDFFKIINLTFEFNNILIFIQDILYFSISGVITFIFLLAFNNGQFSFFSILGEIFGWTLWHLSVGNKVTHFLSKKIYLLKNFLCRILSRVLILKTKIFRILSRIKNFMITRCKKIMKSKKSVKKPKEM